MTKNTFLLSAVFAALVMATGAAHAGSPYKHHYKGFSNASIRGCYVVSTYGNVLPDPTMPSFQLPIATLVRYCADGRGFLKVTATQNIAGTCIVEQKGSGNYDVARNGIARVKAELTNVAVSGPGCENPGFPAREGDEAKFFIRLAIDREGNQQTIVTGLETSAGPIPIVVQGEAVRQ